MHKKKFLCTYFDYNFLPRGLALYQSIEKYCDDFQLFVLALDQKTIDFFQEHAYPHLTVIDLLTYAAHFHIDMDRFRDKKQFYFSLTPGFCLYLMEQFPEVDLLVYLDADVCVFHSPDPIYQEMEGHSIGISPHALHPVYKFLSKHHGHFNVGVNAFRRDPEALECLRSWKNDCDTWTPGQKDYPLGYFSDQIFLDQWPEKYPGLKVFHHRGINVAPWNIANYRLHKKGQDYFVDQHPLIIFHFSGLKKLDAQHWDTGTSTYLVSTKGTLKDLYLEYLEKIESFRIPIRHIPIRYQGAWYRRLFRLAEKTLFKATVQT